MALGLRKLGPRLFCLQFLSSWKRCVQFIRELAWAVNQHLPPGPFSLLYALYPTEQEVAFPVT